VITMRRASDRSLHAPNDSAIVDVVEDPIRELADLRAVDPPPALVARVMTNVTERPEPTFWQWLRRPFRIEVRLSPVGALGLAAGVVLGAAMLLVGPRAHRTAAIAPAAPLEAAVTPAPSASVMVRFAVEAQGARHVALAGSFNDWRTDTLMLAETSKPGLFVVTVPLPPGVHEYMFVIDGRWVTDPTADERRPDGFGRQNALIRL
jgi:hypothetical protein